ncbi:MAG TPA: GyrI-like domain-containing protein [Chloroflexota bacterium]
MTPHMEIVPLEPRPVAGIHATTTLADVGATLGRILPEVQRFVAAARLQPRGKPLARYYRYERDLVEMDAGIALDAPGDGDGTVVVGELPGGDAAMAIHIGPYSRMKKTYDELSDWIEQQGRQPRGAPWEVYVTGPSTEPDSHRWQTEIYWPI